MEYVVVGPGAMGFFNLYGRLKSQVDISILKEISGSSAGALAAVCLLLDVPIEKCITVDAQSVFKPSVKCFLNKYGFVPRKRIINFLIEFFGRDWTFQELYEHTGKILYIAVSSLETKKTVYHSVKTSPNISVLSTLATSVSIPIMFEPEKSNGFTFFDGSVYEMSPGGPFLNLCKEQVTQFEVESKYQSIDIKNGLMPFILKFIRNIISLRPKYDFHTRLVFIEDSEMFNFQMKKEDMLRMFIAGLGS
jgi:hypothetical protein